MKAKLCSKLIFINFYNQIEDPKGVEIELLKLRYFIENFVIKSLTVKTYVEILNHLSNNRAIN